MSDELRRSRRIRETNAEGASVREIANVEEWGQPRVERDTAKRRPPKDMPQVQSIDQLIAAKRQRTQFVDKSDQLQQLFAQLDDAPMTDDEDDDRSVSSSEERTKLELRERQDLLQSDQSDTDSTDGEEDNTLEMAREVLDEDKHDRLREIFNESPGQSSGKHDYRFFLRKCRLPDPLWIDDNYPLLQDTTRERENLIFEMSSNSANRKFLLSSGCLQAWYRREWPPHVLYQWLFQIVAFEEDQLVAHHAYETINALWKNLGSEPAAYIKDEDLGKRRNSNRHIDVDEFIYVLKNYGAVKSELVADNGKIPQSHNSFLFMEDWSDQPGEQRIPVVQFSYILRLFSYSVRTWPEAYHGVGIRYIIRLLLQISVDRSVGNIVLHDLQDGIESCLSVLSKATWENEVLQLASELCTQLPTVAYQYRLLRALKPTYVRCVQLRRMIGLTALACANPPSPFPPLAPPPRQDATSVSNDQPADSSCDSSDSSYQTATTDQNSTTSPYQTPIIGLCRTNSSMSISTTLSDAFDRSQDAMSLTEEVLTAETEIQGVSGRASDQQQERLPPAPRVRSENILQQTLDIIERPHGTFQQRNHDDYDDVLAQIYLVDAAIGSRELELLREQRTVQEIIRHLQVMNRRIGGRSTGVLARVRASAAVQRVWNRLAYATGRESAGDMEEHYV